MYLIYMYRWDTEQKDMGKSIDLFSIEEDAAVDFNRKKTQQYWSIIIYKMDNRSWELAFAASLLYAFESALCCFLLPATFDQCIFC